MLRRHKILTMLSVAAVAAVLFAAIALAAGTLVKPRVDRVVTSRGSGAGESTRAPAPQAEAASDDEEDEYTEGYEDGFDHGYDEGNGFGRMEGYDKGYRYGYSDAILGKRFNPEIQNAEVFLDTFDCDVEGCEECELFDRKTGRCTLND